jgi:DNA-binding response OmpR family regulator
LLENYGYRSVWAASAAAALEKARLCEVDLLLTDVVLPGMNGAELIGQFRSLRPGVPVLCMSGYPDRFETGMALDIPHLRKPFTRREVLEAVRRALDQRELLGSTPGAGQVQVT